MKALSFCLYWLLSAPAWLACWAYFTTGEGLVGGQCLAGPHAPQLACNAFAMAATTGQAAMHAPAQALCLFMSDFSIFPPCTLAVCLAALVGVGLLLCRQVRLLLHGETYLDALSRGARAHRSHNQQHAAAAGGLTAGGPAARMANVRRVFGAGHPLTWLMPAWSVPPAADARSLLGSAREKAS